MKTIIALVLAFMIALPLAANVQAASTKKSCVCKVEKKKHHAKKKHYSRGYYCPGYCQEYATACGTEVVCMPAHYYHCKTEFYYHSGRNTAKVEVCR